MMHAATTLIEYAGVAVFAVTGALVASRKQMDLVGFTFFAVVTAIGGGTIRDSILGQFPVFWVKDPIFVVIAVISAVVVFFTAHIIWSRYRLLLWLDAIGLALFCVLGAEKAIEHGPVVATVMGVITGVAGGIIRDVLGQEQSILLRREIYATAALFGSVTFLVALQMLPRDAAVLVGFLAALTLRALALHFEWSLPPYKARAGRAYGQSDPH